jgi:hypothetical protein
VKVPLVLLVEADLAERLHLLIRQANKEAAARVQRGDTLRVWPIIGGLSLETAIEEAITRSKESEVERLDSPYEGFIRLLEVLVSLTPREERDPRSFALALASLCTAVQGETAEAGRLNLPEREGGILSKVRARLLEFAATPRPMRFGELKQQVKLSVEVAPGKP